MPKQLINVIGVIVVVALLMTGFFLVALPMYLQSLATNGQELQVAQTNSLYQAQVDALREDEARFDEISADLATLRTQIPATPQTDDVFEIVAKAADAADVTVVSIGATDPVAWTPIGAAAEGAPAAEVTDDATATDETGTEPVAPDATTDAASAGSLELPLTISISTDDAEKAADFLDELGMGPRLIGILTSTLSETDGAFQLDVAAVAFLETES